MKKLTRQLLVTIVLLGAFFLFGAGARGAEAAILKFDTTSLTPGVNDTFTVQVIVDTVGADQINSTDAYITYDSSILSAVSVAPGTFFPGVAQNITPGRIYVAGYVNDPATSKTGSGTVATITFKATAAGTTTLAYDCQTGQNETSKVIKDDINATNIIDCSGNGSVGVTVGSASEPNPTAEPTSEAAAPTDVPTSLPQSGTLDNLLRISLPGVVLFTIGILLKFL